LTESRIPTFSDVFVATQTVHKYLKPTPLYHSRQLSRLLNCEAYLKLENLQPTRAFKIRGGLWYMSRMKDSLGKNGVVTASSGNHAQSIAYAGSLFGIRVRVVMPEGVPAVKIQATKDLGAEVILHGAHFEEAKEYAETLAGNEGTRFVHSIDEPILYEGVGSMHLEVIQELPDVQVVINPIGGGSGAASGVIVYKSLKPEIQLIGVQAEGAPVFYESWKKGSVVPPTQVNTKAEGLATSRAYELPLSILQKGLDDIVLLSDEELYGGVRTIFETTRQVAELSGGASTAAAMKIKDRIQGKKVVLIVTGGNISSEMFREIIG
jgi:threonine dehydratase